MIGPGYWFYISRWDLRSAKDSLGRVSNPFYVRPLQGLMWVAGGIVIALILYVGVQVYIRDKLSSAIRNADSLSIVLQASTLYPPTERSSGSKDTSVNALAIAIWLDQLKVTPPDTEIDEILNEENYKILIAALKYGGHCEGNRGERRPLSMPNVERIVDLAAFFSMHCATKNATGVASPVVSTLVRLIAEGKTSGSDLFKRALIDHSVFNKLSVEAPKLEENPSIEKARNDVEAARKVLESAEAVAAVKNPQDPNHAAAKSAVAEAAKAKLLSEDRLRLEETNVSADEKEDREQAHAARSLIYGLAAFRDRGDKSGLADPRMRAVDAFAVALLSSVEADPAVSYWRQWLAAVEGWEQCAILALFLVTGGLMIARLLSFQEHRRAVAEMIKLLEQSLSPESGGEQPEETSQENRRKRRDTQARTAWKRYGAVSSVKGNVGKGGSAIVVDMARAAQSDLAQIHLYGLSDERVDKAAESLKEEIESSRQLIEWGVTTLPALGFLGTVRGILMALSAVGGLSQGDAVSRLGALLSVSGALGIAFATTLLALVCMIILSYADIRQERSEKALVDNVRDFLNDRVLP